MKSGGTEATPQRFAWEDFAGARFPEQPTVAVIVPVYNERAHLEPLLDMVLAQDYPALMEIWLVDGGSGDGSCEILEGMQGRDARLRLLHNPWRNQAAAFNLALHQSRAEVISRFDAHARYEPDVVRRSVEALQRTGAGAVGAIMRPLAGASWISQAIAAAHENRYGMGVARFHQATALGWVDTVWSACYWKHVLEGTGGMREDCVRTEDNDLHARIRGCGYGLWLAPEVRAHYQPRSTLRALAAQHFANGYGVAQTLLLNPKAIAPRHLVPFAFVTSLLLLLGGGAVWPTVAPLWQVEIVLYLCALIFFCAISWRSRPGGYVAVLPLVFLTMHVSYGLGSLWWFVSEPFARLLSSRGGALQKGSSLSSKFRQ